MRRWIILLVLAAVLALPFIFRPRHAAAGPADETVVIISPHNAAIRYEFGRAFEHWYHAKTGKRVFVDWRVIGGTNEIARYLEGAYTAAFEDYWTHRLHRPWSDAAEHGFDNPHVQPAATAAADTPAQAARRAFEASSVGCGIDLFFGGGPYDFEQQAARGHLVDSGVLARHPEWFNDDVIPRYFNGEEFWDPHGLWVGTVLSCYGILYSKESYRHLGIKKPPDSWADLEDPRLLGEVALADPTKSGSVAAAFENIVQQQMQKRWLELMVAANRISAVDQSAVDKQAVHEGWIKGLQMLQLIGANARYFTDDSQKVPIDVAEGNCAAGLCIDFYGREQAEAVRRRGGGDRLAYAVPAGGTSYSVDPIGMLRGAPHPALARTFIDWVLSMDAQKLWDFKPGTPGGPVRFALRRLPVRRDFYTHKDWAQYRSDPDVSPYDTRHPLIYRERWTGPLFSELAFIVRVMCQDTHPELVRAWKAIIKAGRPPAAMAVLQNMSAVDYDKASGEIRAALTSRHRVDTLEMAKKLGDHFRAQYRRAEYIAQMLTH